MRESFFNDEDKQMVINSIKETQKVKEGLVETLAHKKEIYNNQVKVMEHQLKSRQQVLEHFNKFTSTLGDF